MPARRYKGRLIVLEGSDGSGKATQSRMLLRRLRSAGVSARGIAFPQYGMSFFGRMVAQYLRGEVGEVAPALASVLYAADRWEAREQISAWLAQGCVVICDRYVDSNKAHQAARLADAERPAFLRWIECLEYEVFRIPRPDFTIFLHVPNDVAMDLIGKKRRRAYLRGRRRDAHEADPHHLERAAGIYRRLAAGRSAKRGALIECVEKGRLLSRTEIGERVWAALAASGVLRGLRRGTKSNR